MARMAQEVDAEDNPECGGGFEDEDGVASREDADPGELEEDSAGTTLGRTTAPL